MNWSTFSIALSGFVIGIPAVSVLSYYLAKAVIDSFFKARSLAFEHELKLISQRDSIKFSRLHEERAEHIKALYKLAKDFYFKTEDYLPGVRAEQEKQSRAFDALSAMQLYFNDNKIYFSRSLCDLLEKYIQETRAQVFEKMIDSGLADVPDMRGEVVERLQKRWKKIQEDIPVILAAIEDEFRQLLGVEP